jgi:hypothetical protein
VADGGEVGLHLASGFRLERISGTTLSQALASRGQRTKYLMRLIMGRRSKPQSEINRFRHDQGNLNRCSTIRRAAIHAISVCAAVCGEMVERSNRSAAIIIWPQAEHLGGLKYSSAELR